MKINNGDQPATRQFIVDVATAVISALSPPCTDYCEGMEDFEASLKDLENEEDYQKTLKEQGLDA